MEGYTLRLDEVRLHDGCMSSSMLIGVGNGVGDGDDDELFTMAMALARAENETTYAMVALELTNMEGVPIATLLANQLGLIEGD